jgi:hypothetical protein
LGVFLLTFSILLSRYLEKIIKPKNLWILAISSCFQKDYSHFKNRMDLSRSLILSIPNTYLMILEFIVLLEGY